ncbi:MAG: lipid-A-disaccharide synthase N-terminal domain-containing protein [Alphaproteobacteria bacterium]
MTYLFTWFTLEHAWVLVGFLGQALFASRFIIQWFRSELVGRSVIPVAFWWCSLSGGIVLGAYAVYKLDPVFITGQATGLIVYSRNLYLIYRERALAREAAAAGQASPPA